MNRKTIILIIAIMVLMVILGIALYFFFIKKGAPDIPIVSNLFPESETVNNDINGGNEKGEENIINTENEKEQKIIKISDKPVAGAVYDQKNNKIKYVDSASGHIFETDPDGKNSKRISNTTILNVFNVVWANDASEAVFQFIKDGEINNFSASFNGSSTEGIFLSENIKSLAPSFFENKFAYIEEMNGKGTIFTSDFKDKKQQIYSLPLNDFNISWAGKEFLSLATKPASSVLGYLYLFNLKDKSFQKITQEDSLETLWSKDGSRAYISLNTEGGIKNKIIEPQNKKEYETGVKTFSEKCVFSSLQKETVFCAVPQDLAYAKYPDDWHKGKIAFKDNLFKINYLTNNNEILLEKELENRDFDMTNLFLNSDESRLFFINKKDFLLWSVKLK